MIDITLSIDCEFPTYSNLPSAEAMNLPNASILAKQVICLPIYSGLNNEELNYIINIVNG